MKKILLIEDRPTRQEQFLSPQILNKLSQITGFHSPSKSECIEIIYSLNRGIFEGFSNYDLIIAHKSPISAVGLNTLNAGCKKSRSDLILFSGGITHVNFQDNEYRFLSINSKDLYSNHLLPFLGNYSNGDIESLLELIYDKNWKLAFLLHYRQLKTQACLEKDMEYQIILEERLKVLKESFNIDDDFLDEEINNLIKCI